MRILIALYREIPKWERSSQAALVIAFVLLIIDIIILVTIPELQNYALIGAVGLTLGIQAIFMWGNRNLVTPYTQAQRLFIAGDFEQSIDVLEAYIDDEEHPVIDAYVLLGNAYRNLGQLEQSENALQVALDHQADYHFALYGIAKARLAVGDYNSAIELFDTALKNNAPAVANFDLAHAHYRAGDLETAKQILQQSPPFGDAHRILFTGYLLTNGESLNIASDIAQIGLRFWQAEIERFSGTPYAEALERDMVRMQQLL